jgi:hypothetical protein
MLKNHHFHVSILLLIVFLLFVPNSNADEDTRQIPQGLKASLDQLLNLTKHGNSDQPDMNSIGQVIDYLLTPKDLSATYSAGQRNGATSNYFEFTINRSLQDVVALAYNPKIPSYFIIPASLHQSRWLEVDVNGKPQPFPDLSKAWAAKSKPLFFKGVEFMENTPDIYSGAYYAYQLDRAMVLTQYKGHRVLLSMSSQRGKSDVGKKGLVLGNDDDWNYLYTGEKGCTRTGLGWVDSYMYNSESIMVYYEITEPVRHVRSAVFKWVDAGWAGINMAQPYHIKNGVQRFVKTFKQVAEATSLPKPSELAAVVRQIEDLPIQALREKVRDHFNALKARHQDDNRLNRKWFTRLFEDDRYIEGMSREELKAVVCKEYLKYLLGKSHGFDVAFLEKSKDRSKHPG